ncbi:MAG: DUF1592 domain-containing protein [Planctomycetes bacterium]|nr:DUF1592 domain-containing protein [Planctomycetota bacterium]
MTLLSFRRRALALLGAGSLFASLAPAAIPQDLPRDPPDFAADVRPVLEQFCFRCHGAERQKGDLRLDRLPPQPRGLADAEAWDVVLDVLDAGEMPPRDEEQPSDEQRRTLVRWMRAAVAAAVQQDDGDRPTTLRRLTRAQYAHTLQDLLGVGIDFGRMLPPDGRSAYGFSNDADVLQATELHLEDFQRIARLGLAEALVSGDPPPVARYRVRFGRGIGAGHVAAHVGGYQSVPLATDDFVVELLDADGQPRVGADAVERTALDDVRRRIGVGLRGSSQERFHVVPDGLLLYGALPHVERAPGSWQGPSPNVKLEMQRVFPERGDFVMRVVASRALVPAVARELLVALDEPVPRASWGADAALRVPDGARVVAAAQCDQRRNLRIAGDDLLPEDVPKDSNARFFVDLPDDGFYQLDLVHPVSTDAMASIRLFVDGMKLDLRPQPDAADRERGRAVTSMGVAALRGGRHQVRVGGPFFVGFDRVVVTRLDAGHPLVERLSTEAAELNAAIGDRVPVLRVYVGTRTDDGMDYLTFDQPREVRAPVEAPEEYVFHGRLENLPIPEPESGDTEILSGFMLLGLWNDHLVKSAKDTGPPLLIRSIEFEAPFLPQWPPAPHRTILFDSELAGDEAAYTRAVLERFMTRAFRRPLLDGEVEPFFALWQALRPELDDYVDSVRETLVAVLCSPRFLFLAEPAFDDGPLSEHALASRLAYFLWDSPPDAALLALADAGRLRGELLQQVDRLLDDPRAERFVRAYAHEWLRLDRLTQVPVDVGEFPAFTRFVQRDMQEETVQFLLHTLRADLSLFTLVDSDFAMLDQNLAEFYGIPGVRGPSFRPVPVAPELGRGGLLAQGAFLTGHSDGRQPHPIKRAVWLKEKLLGERPPPPPPNVPRLDDGAPGAERLTLKERLEQHRNSSSCMDCHRRIDPYGFVFERYNAVGLLETTRRGRPIDATSVLPDGTALDGVDELKRWLVTERRDAFAAAVIEHLYAWALGREPRLSDAPELATILTQVRISGYRMRAVVRAIVASPSFTSR